MARDVVSMHRREAALCKALGQICLVLLLAKREDEASATEALATETLATATPASSSGSSPAPDDASTGDARAGRVESGTPVEPTAAAETPGGVGDFPGAFWVPGTSVRLRIGGFARLNVIHNWAALGADDRFVVATIPVEGDVDAGKGPRSSWSAAQTRVSLDSRMPSDWGLMRTYLEADFYGAGNTFRIRHAYGQVGPLLIGQTWSTLTDARVSPELIDFEGQDGSVKVRQPVIRATWSAARWYSASLALESNQTQVTGGVAAPQFPDALARIGIEGDFGLIFVSGVARKLTVESEGDPGRHAATTGVGVSANAWLPLPLLSAGSDVTLGVTFGRGVARYLVGPSGAAAEEGGKDVVYDPVTNVARALPVLGAFAALRIFWISNLRSTLCYSGASIDNVADAPPGSYRETHYAALNVIYSPVERVDLGAEMLAGSRRNHDGAWGTATQTQLAATWRF